jgi:hypothetical protein
MKTFKEFVDLMEVSNVLQDASNILANCRSNPFEWLPELHGVLKNAEQQGDPNAINVIRQIIDLSRRFLQDIRNFQIPNGGINPRYNDEFQKYYALFMKNAHQILNGMRANQPQ